MVKRFAAVILGLLVAIGGAVRAVGAGAGADEESDRPLFSDQIEVVRVLAEVRVVKSSGEPVLGLAPEDFQVELDGQPAEVESVSWIETSVEEGAVEEWRPPASDSAGLPPLPPGRLVVVLVQTDFQSARLRGLVRTTRYAEPLFSRLGPNDRVALAAFGSHLEVHSDFTNDLEHLIELMNMPDLMKGGVERGNDSYPSLLADLDLKEARDAASISQALDLIGQALAPLPGPKSIILFGWGIGRYSSGGVGLDQEYIGAYESLARARATLFVLDITEADYHSLEEGLRTVAMDTGGTYAKTWEFPEVAVTKLARILTGYYELSIRKPEGVAGESFEVEVKVAIPGTSVLVRPVLVSGPRAEVPVKKPRYLPSVPPS